MDFFSPEIIGAIMIGCMLFAIFIGFPISFTLIFLGLVFGYWGFGKLVFYLMTLQFNMIMRLNPPILPSTKMSNYFLFQFCNFFAGFLLHTKLGLAFCVFDVHNQV